MREGSLAVWIISSGESVYFINAIAFARAKKAGVNTLTVFESHNKSEEMGEVTVYVRCKKYGIVESIHNLMLQQVVDLIMDRDGIRL